MNRHPLLTPNLYARKRDLFWRWDGTRTQVWWQRIIILNIKNTTKLEPLWHQQIVSTIPSLNLHMQNHSSRNYSSKASGSASLGNVSTDWALPVEILTWSAHPDPSDISRNKRRSVGWRTSRSAVTRNNEMDFQESILDEDKIGGVVYAAPMKVVLKA